jgi:hypothetical protein
MCSTMESRHWTLFVPRTGLADPPNPERSASQNLILRYVVCLLATLLVQNINSRYSVHCTTLGHSTWKAALFTVLILMFLTRFATLYELSR